MTESTMNALVRAARSLDIECEPYLEYSGRGMFGKTTCGVVIPTPTDFTALCVVAGRATPDGGAFAAFLGEVRKVSFDSMGHDVIAY